MVLLWYKSYNRNKLQIKQNIRADKIGNSYGKTFALENYENSS